MTFAYTKNDLKDGTKALGITSGTFTNSGGGNGGRIVTGLSNIYHFSASGTASTSKYQRTISSGTVTLTTTADDTGTWLAYGI